jgi:hypothetical protein
MNFVSWERKLCLNTVFFPATQYGAITLCGRLFQIVLRLLTKSTKYFQINYCKIIFIILILKFLHFNNIQWAGQSRMILITYNKGCVRFPTERNNSSHELTTTMHHLSKCPCGGPMFLKAYTWVSNPGEVFRLPSN